MKQKTERSAKKNVANFFGSFGYLFCCLQWFWAIMLYFSVLQSLTLSVYPPTDRPADHSHALTFTAPTTLEMIIIAIVVIVMVAVTVYALIKIPMGIVKTGNKVVHRTAETMTPIVIKVQHKKDTKKVHARITAELMLVIKALLVIVPVSLTAASGLLEKQSVDYTIAMTVGCGLAGFGVVFFAVQYLLAGLLRVKMSDLW